MNFHYNVSRQSIIDLRMIQITMQNDIPDIQGNLTDLKSALLEVKGCYY